MSLSDCIELLGKNKARTLVEPWLYFGVVDCRLLVTRVHDTVARHLSNALHFGEIGLGIGERLVVGKPNGDAGEVLIVVHHFRTVFLYGFLQSILAFFAIVIDDEAVRVAYLLTVSPYVGLAVGMIGISAVLLCSRLTVGLLCIGASLLCALSRLTVCRLANASSVTNGCLAGLNLLSAALRCGRLQRAKDEREENHYFFHRFISIDEIKPSGLIFAVTW